MMNLVITTLARATLILALAATSVPAIAQPAVDGLTPFRATYTVLNDGKPVGKSVQTLSYNSGTGLYTFETRTEFRGLLRLAAPRPVVEHGEFTIRDGRLRPSRFMYEDGSRGGDDNVTINFDWSTHRLIASGEESEGEWPLPDEGLDRASARIALMRDLAAGIQTRVYHIIDPDESAYEMLREGTELRTTPIGDLQTIRVVQQRPGSSRRTVTWSAPNLEFLAVRIEQQRDDRGPVAFAIESVEW